jgi:hypothetical protein
MRTSRSALLLIVLLAAALALPAQAQQVCDGVGAACSLEDLGSDRYRFTFVVTNGSPSENTIFKWNVEPPNVAAEWVTVSFGLPAGWTGNHPDHHLDFQTGNGSGTLTRIFSPSAAGCGGSNSLTFVWTFDNVGGPIPDCADFDVLDYTYHVQPLSSCENVGITFTCPGLLPVEETTWGSVKSSYRN